MEIYVCPLFYHYVLLFFNNAMCVYVHVYMYGYFFIFYYYFILIFSVVVVYYLGNALLDYVIGWVG